MLRHIVFFTARDPKDREAIFDGLSLLVQSPHAKHFEIGRNLKSDPISGATPDFVVYGEFESEEQLTAFKADPLYQQSIDIVRPLRDMRVAADFLTDRVTDQS
jgi:hypothetical protein